MIKTVIFTHPGQPAIHAEEARNHCESVRVWESIQKTPRNEAWSNADRNIVDWWLSIGRQSKADQFLLCEWDVRITTPPQETIIVKADCVCSKLVFPIQEGRAFKPFRTDASKLPQQMRKHICAVVPLGVLLMTRQALDCLSQSDLFDKDIFCELRVATILAANGFSIAQNPLWNNVGTDPRKVVSDHVGISHPVKS